MVKAYSPFVPAKRPGGRPESKPEYRILVHKRFLNKWEEIAERIGLEQAKKLYDSISSSPWKFPDGVNGGILKGKSGKPESEGFSRTHHWRVPGSATRVDYQYHNEFTQPPLKDPHKIVKIININYSSH
jgi:hypothetical protein